LKFLIEKTFAEKAASYLPGHDIEAFSTAEITREAFIAAVRDADVLGFRWQLPFPIDRAVLNVCEKLAYVHKSGAGLEHSDVIDLEALKDLGILFSNNSGINAEAVAEHAVMLTLMALRPASLQQMSAMRNGNWTADIAPEMPAPRTLKGKVVGIVGMGRIGTAIAERLKPMGVSRILGYRRGPLSPDAAAFAEPSGLDALLSQAEVVIFCLPITDDTRGLIDASKIRMMRPDATLVNVGRGAVFDEDALFNALSQKKLRAAGLDVLTDEPSHSSLMRLPNVVLTPHTAGTAVEVQEMQISASLEAMATFAAGRRPPRLVNGDLLYSPALRAAWMAVPRERGSAAWQSGRHAGMHS